MSVWFRAVDPTEALRDVTSVWFKAVDQTGSAQGHPERVV